MAVIDQIELPDGTNYDIYGVNVQEISYDDYQALTPEQKNNDIAYCIIGDVTYGEASGAIASFSDGSANPLADLKIAINPVQAGSGDPSPSNPRTISGWTGANVTVSGMNLLPPTIPSNIIAGTLNTSGAIASAANARVVAIPVPQNADLCIQKLASDTLGGTLGLGDTGNIAVGTPVYSYNGFTNVQTITLNSGNHTWLYINAAGQQTIEDFWGSRELMISAGTSRKTYVAPSAQTTYPISWQTEAGTVYGGELDATSGEMTVDRVIIEFDGDSLEDWTLYSASNVNQLYINVAGARSSAGGKITTMCETYKSISIDNRYNNYNTCYAGDNSICFNIADYTTATWREYLQNNPVKVVYTLKTPQTYQLTPTQVSSLLGNNNIWADCGGINYLKYIKSIQSYNELRINDNIIASSGFAYHAADADQVNGHTVLSDVPSNATFTDTTYTFANGTNGFTVTPSGGTAQTVTVTPSITNNVTGSGTSGYIAKFNGANTITNGAQLGSDTTKFLRNDGEWAVPPGAGGGVTGVKGDAESTYRTGNVNLTPANLGLESKSAASGGTDLSLVTTGEKAVWDEKPSTDTKNTAGSTDTSSKIYLVGATSQAANPQTYSQDTAYVGTDGCLYSGGTKVEVVSNNAGYHNSIYRGKSLGTSITTAQWNAISAGTFDDMYIGDYWTLSTAIGSTTSNIQYVIAGFDYWWNCGDSYPQSSNKHHVVLVPATNLYSAQMNATSITTGGYIGSAMYTTNLANARTGISTLFGNHLYSVRRLFTNSVNTVGQATGWAWATSSVDLMSETMVYGHPVWTTSGFEVGVDRTILPLFALNPASASIYSSWWLRSVATPSNFAYVSVYGNAASYNASTTHGVRPAFAIY